jgi:DNA (cytosine-5)-methyltransferase 1
MPKLAIKRTKKSQPADKPLVKSDMVSPQRKVRIVSLFSGAGGLEIAACRTGKIEAIVSTDSNATFLSTVEKNMPVHFPEVRHGSIVADIRELKGVTVKNILGSTPDIVVGGPPCDDYTKVGLRRGFEGEKGPLIFEFLRIVEEIEPACFVFENVPNLVAQFKDVFNRFLLRTREIGYATNWSIIKACDFGAPTQRSRVFVVGWRNPHMQQSFHFPQPTHADPSEIGLLTQPEGPLQPFKLVCDVLSGLPDVNIPASALFANHTGRTHRPETIEHLKTVPPGKKIAKSYRYRAPWSGLTQSLTAGVDHSTKSFIHPQYHREMSVREYARLHLFPDSWVFAGNHHNGIKQVANSVPLPLGEAVMASSIECLLSANS